MANTVQRGQVTGPSGLGLLPAEATSFVGRATELAAISALLGTARMVTVVGPAGVGKTRISLRVAAAVADKFPDGVWLADLGGISDPELLAPAVAAALGRPAWDHADRDAAAGLAAFLGYLRGRRLLLILDTCEHVVDACAALADTVLRAAPGVTLLATSRQPLDAPGEHAFPLLPLPAEAEAVDLFAQRAASVVPGFTVTPANRPDVVRLCRRLDGIPLAIELASVRLRALPLSELVRQLESGVRGLTVNRRGTSPRHQTLRAAVEWSYGLCTPAERVLWQRLSVFAGTFDVSWAEEVCADGRLPGEQVVPALVGLVDKSVVLRDGADPSRYRLLGGLREFGADRLAEGGEREFFLDRLTAASLAVAEDFDASFRGADGPGGDQVAAVRRLNREYENIREALGYALGPGSRPAGPAGAPPGASPYPADPVDPVDPVERWRRGAELAVRLSCYWQLSGLLDEGRHWLSRAADRFPEPASERAWLLGARGRLATVQGDLTEALADISESVRLAAAAGRGMELAVARGYLYLSLAYAFAGRHAEALAAGEAARQRLAACGHQAGLLGLEAQFAHLHQLAGDIDAAVGCCERGLAQLAAPETEPGAVGPGSGEPESGAPASGTPGSGAAGGERWISGYLHLVSGLALAQRPGREPAAAAALRRALSAAGDLGDVVGTAYAVEAFGWLAARREQYERAAWLLGAAEQLWARTGHRVSGCAAMEEFHQRAVKATRQALGERRYTAAYAHGSVLDLDAVAKGAVDETGEPPAGPDGDAASPAGEPAAAAAAAALTRREREIAELVASGLSNREIATRLFISKRTVDAHVEHIFGKLEISSRVQLTVLLREPAHYRSRAAGAPGMGTVPGQRLDPG